MGVFKSYDIRGVFGSEITVDLAHRIGISLGRHFRGFPEHKGKDSLHLIVGRDMRPSAAECAPAVIEGLRQNGIRVTDIGMVSTPCLYFAVAHLGADGGVMCTASHNPAQYIGFKVCRELALPIGYDAGLKDVEATLGEPPVGSSKGTLSTYDIDGDYIAFLLGMAKNVQPLKVVVDASNGMAGKYLERLFAGLPCRFEGMFLEPDGTFPNHEADPSKLKNLEALSRRVRESGAFVGFCLDGDGDRLGIVDEKGEAVRGDMIAALLSRDTLRAHPGQPVCYDLRSSKVLRDVITEGGGKPIRSRVGHAHIKKQMREIGSPFGSELSGHFYFQLEDRQRFYADSGLIALVRMLNILSEGDELVSQRIAPLMKYAHTGELNFKVEDQKGALAAIRAEFTDGAQDELDGVSVQYPTWWFNVRPSNTEPLLRLTLEGDDVATKEAGLQRVLKVLHRFGQEAAGH